jgi:NAD(P)-dependent dehydrogenase (short-subunit alcohol dehydrogenase family)
VILVTGTSSGLGLAIAKQFAAKNHRVFGTSRTPRAGASDGFRQNK